MIRNHNEKHARMGRMTNQPGTYDSSQLHASTAVCERAECQASARHWVQGMTGQPAVYVPDPPEVRARGNRRSKAVDPAELAVELLPCRKCRGRLTANGDPCTRCQ